MLKYSIKVNNDNIEKKELVWKEKYLSPDLSFVSGVCDTSYHLEKYSNLAVSSEINNSAATVKVESSNFKRYGYAVFNNIKYDVTSASTVIYNNDSASTITYKYVKINDKFFYYNDDIKGYKIDNIFYLKNGEISSEPLVVSAFTNDYITIPNEIAFIDDNKVIIKGYDLDYDVTTDKLTWNGNDIETSSLTWDSYKCVSYAYKHINDYTKFKLSKTSEYDACEYDSISYCKPYYYIDYKSTYCYIDIESTSNNTCFYCYAPKGLNENISNTIDDYSSSEEYADAQEIVKYPLYFVTGTSVYDINDYVARFDELGIKAFELTLSNLHSQGIYNVTDLDSLNNIHSFVKIDDYYYLVQSNITNSNDGKKLIITLSDEKNGLDSGDLILTSLNNSDNNIMLPIYSSDTEFIIYDGDKYQIEKNLCDKLVMLDKEYDINYIEGKVASGICLVTIDDDEIPMYIVSVDGGDYSGGTLQRLGNVINDLTSSTESVYSIQPYDGVRVKENTFQRYDNSVQVTNQLDIQFVITQSKGSSTFVCKPYIDEKLLSSELRDTIDSDLCGIVIDNQDNCIINVKNKIFGNSPITSDLPFSKEENPISSDDYYKLFDDLKVYVNTNYIMLPLGLTFNSGGYAMQDDLVENDFYEAEKEKAINPIVDMEKDVYLPKFISNKNGYKGCNTDFKQIYEIEINMHFRTRNLDSWKINESTNRYDVSGYTDNWFVTDVHPYKEMIALKEASATTLMNTSDLMGLLYFTNDDIFYQRKKISKSFLRFSFYDSTDSQTQNLLATSTVFMDEHGLYKKFIDNSRKNVYDYANVTLPEWKTNPKGYAKVGEDVSEAVKTNKINVFTEFIDKRDKNCSYTGTSWNENVFKKISFDETRRLGSRFVIKNKYETDSSSEGFYLYMFKNYSTKLHPRQIFMKVEFNHAGVGKTLDFQIPMKWEKTNTKSLYYNPTSKYTLWKTDLVELKKGITLEMKEAQSYIPLYAVYDFKNKEYAYVFDDRYVDVTDGIATLNIFEPKYKDESENENLEGKEKLIKGESDRYAINVNTSQFDEKYF